MGQNKHLVAALIIAPVLAIIAWIAVDRLAGERPQAAVAGAAYELAAHPMCHHASGRCELSNGNFLVEITSPSPGRLVLAASHALEGVRVAPGSEAGGFLAPRAMEPAGDDGTRWTVAFSDLPTAGTLRVVAAAGGSSYFAEPPLVFTSGE